MGARPILVYGDPRLEATNRPVERFDEEIDALVEDLFETGWKAPGLGLAAPQIGINIRLATIDVLANPTIVHHQGKTSLEEGCLSFPGLFTNLVRPSALTVRAQNANGDWRDLEAEGLLAQAVCHELDHLDGVLLVHHLRGMKKRLFLRRVEQMRRLGVWSATA
jgi:peptide deformylase